MKNYYFQKREIMNEIWHEHWNETIIDHESIMIMLTLVLMRMRMRRKNKGKRMGGKMRES